MACGAMRLAVPVVVLAAGLSGRASISEKFRNTAAQMPGIGLPAGAPERTAEPVAYPAVHDMPPPRNSNPMSVVEQEQMEHDLAAARDEQQTEAGIQTEAKKKKAKAAAAARAKVVPASTRSATIY